MSGSDWISDADLAKVRDRHTTIIQDELTAPKRIQLSRAKGWRKPEGVIVVSRPTRWGNHYEALPCYDPSLWAVYNRRTGDGPEVRFNSRREALAEAVKRHATWMRTSPAAPDVTELRGHDLACWCPLDQPCHADILLELANGDSS